MYWAFIIALILLIAASITVAVFSLRQSYCTTLRDIDCAAEKLKKLTQDHIDVYERLYALVFFFGNDSSADKNEFGVSDNSTMPELFETNSLVDVEISILFGKVSEALKKERGASLKKIDEELAAYESDFIMTTALLNEKISFAKRFYSLKLSRNVFSKLGTCKHLPIDFGT